MRASAQGPLARFAGFVVSVLVLMGAIVIGGVVLSAVIGLAVVAAAVVAGRLWWLRRKIRRALGQRAAPPADANVIETEYRVVDVSEKDERQG